MIESLDLRWQPQRFSATIFFFFDSRKDDEKNSNCWRAAGTDRVRTGR